ncbi:alanine racemase [Amylibacter ulvae]|uniref:Alanine racemase n=1 Tax=Paramylibacter ulvae TaxID=1651968 RepID=A0ABQ3CWP4_9RHOB|nr:alanine/ornithine racemase family PLP-dependent enzyme [Amylibacter ulvae]GHA44189.1 alanine racemase [Amylibacter ulvae]
MITPRIEIDLDKIRYNTRYLVERLNLRDITVTGVTKAVCGHPAVAKAMLDGGAINLADSRVQNILRMRKAGIACSMAMIRSPMLSQLDAIVQNSDTSFNTEISTVTGLAAAARKSNELHNIVLMVEMGDMREGIMPKDLKSFALRVIKIPGLTLTGIGTNFACLGGIPPDIDIMNKFSSLVREVETACGLAFTTVSGGNSASLTWALGNRENGCVNNLRLGEAILLGVDPVCGTQISGLHTDAFTLVAEVIETKIKTDVVQLKFINTNLKDPSSLVHGTGSVARSILAIGLQDTDIGGLKLPEGVTSFGATSDHMIVCKSHAHLQVGQEVKFQMNYSAVMQAMSAPDIVKTILGAPSLKTLVPTNSNRPRLALL